MKAAFFMQHGGPEVMQYGELPDPVAGNGEERHLRGKLVFI